MTPFNILLLRVQFRVVGHMTCLRSGPMALTNLATRVAAVI